MAVETIRWKNNSLVIIDQTLLPLKLKYVKLRNITDVYHAIKTLAVRGAPAIGIAAAFGLYIGIKNYKAKTREDFFCELEKALKYLASSRPTAVNLFWALNTVKNCAVENNQKSVSEIKKVILEKAIAMLCEDDMICKTLGDVGQKFLRSGDTVLTHCNAGGLATATYGTALSVIYRAVERGKKISVFADETRPLLQGARLTAWELLQNNIPATLICDNMAAKVMSKGWVNAVIVGADRIASNGDFANKIGTYGLAVLAKYHKIPFYCAAPLSTFDISLKNGGMIPIEERHEDEIKQIGGKQIAPKGVKVFNPAFDVTPSKLVTAFFTEAGALLPPFAKSIKAAFKK